MPADGHPDLAAAVDRQPVPGRAGLRAFTCGGSAQVTALDKSAQRPASAPARARYHPGAKRCDRCCQREAAREVVGRLRDTEPEPVVQRIGQGPLSVRVSVEHLALVGPAFAEMENFVGLGRCCGRYRGAQDE